MSVSVTNYVVLGYVLNNKIDVYDDKYIWMLEGHKWEKFSIIDDGMSGEYIVFWIILSRINNNEEMPMAEIDTNNLSRLMAEVREGCKELVEQREDAPKLLMFQHYS